MKKLLGLLLVIGFGLGFIGCSSDDDGPSDPPFSIVGTWKVTGKLINGVSQDISGECMFKGSVKFVSGGIFVEDVWGETSDDPCHLMETIGGTWEKNGDSYKVIVTTEGFESILPETFTPEIQSGNNSQFRISATSLGTTTTLIFTKL